MTAAPPGNRYRLLLIDDRYDSDANGGGNYAKRCYYIAYKADAYRHLLTKIESMKVEIKLLAVGITLGLTLLTTVMHATRATEHAVAPDAAASDMGAPSVLETNPIGMEATPAITASDIIRYGRPEKLALRSSVALMLPNAPLKPPKPPKPRRSRK